MDMKNKNYIVYLILVFFLFISFRDINMHKQREVVLEEQITEINKKLEQSKGTILTQEDRINTLVQENGDLRILNGLNVNSEVDTQITSYNALSVYMKRTGLDNYILPYELAGFADEYGIDSGFMLSFFIQETGWGKSQVWLSNNNPAGIKCGRKYCTYASPIEGFRSLGLLLRRYTDGSISYVGKRNTIAQVREKWAEADDKYEIVGHWKDILKEGLNEFY